MSIMAVGLLTPSGPPPTPSLAPLLTAAGWHPSLDPETTMEVYRYEIYAPGGIWIAKTLGDRYQYPSQDEVCFVAGIAPQYIRSAQRFRLICGSTRFTRQERVDNEIILNEYYNPQSHPPRQLCIQRPIFDYVDENCRRVPLNISFYPPPVTSHREKREVSTNSEDPMDWYARDVANYESYINAAFRSSNTNEAYLFMKDEYVLLNYAPDTTNDKVLNGPLLICDGYPFLTSTAFAEHGIDCAFGSHQGDEAFIFSGNLCAQINYAPHSANDKIIKGPMTITEMFPFFKGTAFESSIDAAFEATTKYEAYLFKDNQYALINYDSNSKLIAICLIKQGFVSLEKTKFESGIDAAFASHKTDEAYLFKGDSCALIHLATSTTNDYIICGGDILPDWTSLQSILPRKNRGLDVRDHAKPDADRDHDEL